MTRNKQMYFEVFKKDACVFIYGQGHEFKLKVGGG